MNSSIPCDMQSLELALLYDEEGKLTDVIEGSGLFDSVPLGTSLETLMDSGSLETARRFLSLVQAQGAAFDWELNLRIADAVRRLHFAGAKCGDRVLLVGATSRAAVSWTFERVASKRGFPNWAAVSARTDPGQPDDSVYCELSRLNNELVNSQRELAKKNAEVEQRVEERTKELSEMNRELQHHDALLQSREKLLKIFVQHVPAAVAMLDRDMRYLQVSDRWCADFSLDSSQLLGRSHYEVFPDLPERWRQIHRRGLEGETLRAEEDRWDRASGTTWSRWEIRPWQNQDGVQGGILIFSEDITRRKQMEEAVSDISRKLIEAHEEERTWIARELHDDVNQRMALLAIELDRWNQQLPPSAVEFHDHIHHASQRLSDIAKDIQALSHRLHSSKLEYLGLVAAAKSFCKELSEQQKVEIDFIHTAIPVSVPKEISLCLFRVLQETLQNAVKHSGVRHFKVELRGTEGEIQLTVSDLGVGFDPQDAIHRRGLGLISMRERIQLVSGEFSIKSHPGSGTTIHARVPFDSSSDSARAAG